MVLALPDEFGYEEPRAHCPEQRAEVLSGIAQHEVVVAAGVARRAQAELARGIAAQEVTLHHTCIHNIAVLRRDPYVVERTARQRLRDVRKVADVDVRREYRLADAVQQKRRA